MASSSSRVFKVCRPLFAASKSPTPITTTAAPSASSSKKSTIATPTSKPFPKKTTTAANTSKPSPPPSPAAADKKKKTAAVKEPVKFTRPSGLLKVSPVSPAFRNFLGVPESARTQAVKKIWDYIKLHNLQNPNNRREIVCDNELKKIFEGRETLGMLEVSKLLTPHFVKI